MKMQQTVKRIAIVAGSFLWMYILYYKCGMVFETNDDRYTAEILSGTMTGTPDAHAFLLNYFLAGILAFSYKLCPRIMWYGLLLAGAHTLICGVFFYGIFKKCQKITDYLIAFVPAGCILLCTISSFTILQFTVTAELLALVGYVCLISERDSKNGFRWFFLLELLAVLLRRKGMFVIQPVGIAAYGMVILFDKKKVWKEKFCHYLKIILLLTCILMVDLLGRKVGYSNPQWAEFLRFNQARVMMFDYYGCPEYEEVEPILEKYQVTRQEYEAFGVLDFDKTNIPLECAEELAAYTKATRAPKHSAAQIINSVFTNRTKEWNGLSMVANLLWIFGILWGIFEKRFPFVVTLLGTAIADFFVWVFLHWNGRILDRVMVPLLIAEIALLFVLLFSEYMENPGKKKKWVVYYAVIAVVCICYFSFVTGKTQYRYVVNRNKGQLTYMNSFYEIQDYCNEHPEQKFLLGDQTMCWFTGSVFDKKVYTNRNNIVVRNWFSTRPSMKRYVKEYLPDGIQDIYFIVYDSEVLLDQKMLAFLTEKSRISPQLVDSFETSSGGKYSVFYFGKKL